MKTFKDFVLADTHGHTTFEKMYSCFLAFVGRERGRGDTSAKEYKVNADQCRDEYHELLMQGNISCSQVSASTVLRSFVRHQTVETIRGGCVQSSDSSNKRSFMSALSESTIAENDTDTGGTFHDIVDSQAYFEGPSRCDFRDAVTPPSNRPESPIILQSSRSLSPGSPTVRQAPLANVFETSFTEEDVITQQAAAWASLSQQDVWTVDDVDLLSKFNNFKHQQPQPRLSLALDGIADISPGSGFFLTLSQKERMLASAVGVRDINEKWTALSPILSRVCVPSYSYEDVVQALRKEDPCEPIVEYLRDITYHYNHYLKFADEVPRNINEREGFGDLTWPFIRGALTLADILSRCFEIPVVGTKERKNHGRDLSVETEEQALMVDAVAVFGDHQIYLAEASLIYEPKLDKQIKDKFKLGRCMRDSWNSQIRSIAREAMPPSGLSVFGSTSFGDETKFYSMDFAGTYRMRQVGRMLVPLNKAHFGSRMKACIKSCLGFALLLQDEIKRRTHLVPTEEDLTVTCDMILVQTRTTPTKETKKRRVSGIFSTHQ